MHMGMQVLIKHSHDVELEDFEVSQRMPPFFC